MEITWVFILFMLLFGILFGALSAITGTGGGVFYVSFMTIFLMIPIDDAIDTSNFIILITSAAGFLTFLKDKRTKVLISLIYSAFAILGSIACTVMLIFVVIDNTILRYIFAIVLIIVGINMLIKPIRSTMNSKKKVENNQDPEVQFSLDNIDIKSNLKLGIPLFLLAGFVANLIGIGGGVINVPVLNLIFHFPIHYATAVSTSVIFFTSIYIAISKIFLGEINYLVGLLIGAGSVSGAILGAKISGKMPKKTLQIFIAIVLMILAIITFFR